MKTQVTMSDLSAEESNAIVRRLEALMTAHEKSMTKAELTELLIGAAILEGLEGGKRITDTLATLGMNKRHAGIVLNALIGVRWQRGCDGRYSLLEAN